MTPHRELVYSAEFPELICQTGETNDDVSQSDLDSSRVIHESEAPIECAAGYCSGRGVCTIGLQRLCVHHFITHCYGRLRDCTVAWCVNRVGGMPDLHDVFLHECIVETAKVLQRNTEIDHVRRGHLMDVFLWASELATKRSVSK